MQQQKLVAFLYQRFRFGIFITLFVALLMSSLAYVELSIQGRSHWVVGWFLLLCVVLFVRWRGLQGFLGLKSQTHFNYQLWHNRFFIGVVVTGSMLGLGAAILMPYVTIRMQIILHSLLLVMASGAIAYLSTSLRVYISYLLAMMLPVTIWLMLQGKAETYLLGSLYLFFIGAGFISVKRMNQLLNDALYYRYDNEALIDDLQRLLQSVSQTNKALEKISTTDELTGVSNYRAFRVHLESIWHDYQDNNAPVSLVKLNVDFYHEYNAHYGEQLGDKYLCQVATMLTEQISHPSQMVARLQGAEFALLLPGVGAAQARDAMSRVARQLREQAIEHVKSRVEPVLTMSAGIGCQTVASGSSSRELRLRADTALRIAIEKGRNRIEVLEA